MMLNMASFCPTVRHSVACCAVRRANKRKTAVLFVALARFFGSRGGGGGDAVASLSCVDCQLTCHMLEILDGTRTGHSTEAAAAILGKLSFWPPAKCGFICIVEI